MVARKKPWLRWLANPSKSMKAILENCRYLSKQVLSYAGDEVCWAIRLVSSAEPWHMFFHCGEGICQPAKYTRRLLPKDAPDLREQESLWRTSFVHTTSDTIRLSSFIPFIRNYVQFQRKHSYLLTEAARERVSSSEVLPEYLFLPTSINVSI